MAFSQTADAYVVTKQPFRIDVTNDICGIQDLGNNTSMVFHWEGYTFGTYGKFSLIGPMDSVITLTAHTVTKVHPVSLYTNDEIKVYIKYGNNIEVTRTVAEFEAGVVMPAGIYETKFGIVPRNGTDINGDNAELTINWRISCV